MARVAGLPALAAAACIILTGCDTIGQDLNDLSRAFSPPTPREAAQQMLNPHDPDERREGTILICNSPFGGVDVYVRAYRDMVQNELDPLARAAAVRALAKHGTSDDALLLADQLDHEHYQVRWEAARGLQRLHNPEVVAPLVNTLKERTELEIRRGETTEDADIRVEAALALGQYPEDRVFQGLVSALDARELAVNRAAEQSLMTLTGQDYGLDPRAWLNWYGGNLDPFALQQDYCYPTYHRKRRWYESLVFWSNPVVELPAPPAGLRPLSERRTYEAEDDDDSAN